MAQQLIFWGAVLALTGAGARRIVRRRHAARHGLVDNLTLALTAALVGFMLLELVARCTGAVTAPRHGFVGCTPDARLGWIGKVVDGDLQARRPRVLVLGDSFTAADGVPEDSVYYRPLVDELGMELWVRGGSGWGTLQELLALDAVFDRVRPDLVVLQVCSNDFINNSWELENATVLNSNMSRRPYWEHGSVVMRYPERWLGPALVVAARSALVAQAVRRVNVLRAGLAMRGRLGSVERDIDRGREAYAPWPRARVTTEEIVAALTRRVGRTRVVALPVDDIAPYTPAWREILKRHGVTTFDAGLQRIRRASAAGQTVFQADGAHWNALGHRLVGRALAAWLRGMPEDAASAFLAGDLTGTGGVDLLWSQDTRLMTELLQDPQGAPRVLAAFAEQPRLFGLRRVARGAWQIALRDARSGGLMLHELRRGRWMPGETRIAVPAYGSSGATPAGIATDDGRACVVWHDVDAQQVVFMSVEKAAKSPLGRVQASLPLGSRLLGTPDLDGDGRADTAWSDSVGRRVTFWTRAGRIDPEPAEARDPSWRIEAVTNVEPAPDRPGATVALIWRHRSSQRLAVWYLDARGRRVSARLFGAWTEPGAAPEDGAAPR